MKVFCLSGQERGAAGLITGSQIIVKCLESEGVRVVFGYPGATVCPIYDSLIGSSVRHILVRQEQNAGHAANGYARVAGVPGVCMATSGPGATNLITALATAYMDSIPLVAITGQVSSDLLGRDVFQEADITGAAEPFTKYSYLVKSAEDLPRVFKEAFYIASTGRPGPVLIDIPVDVQQAKVRQFRYPEAVHLRGYKPTLRGHSGQVKRLAEAMRQARTPLLCVGGGVIRSSAQEEVLALSRRCGIPIVSTLMGVGAIPTSHELYLGMIGMHGYSQANRAMPESDLLIIIGARVGDRAVSDPHSMERQSRIAHIDVDPAEIGKNVGTSIPIVGDARTILRQLLETDCCPVENRWPQLLSQLRHQPHFDEPEPGYINPKYFVRRLTERLPEDAIYVADVGQNQIWSAYNMVVKAKTCFLSSGGMGTMGYAIPAAMGARLADPTRQVIAACGDGSFQMSMNELASCLQAGVQLKVVVFTNRMLGMIREIQQNSYGGHIFGSSLEGSPDFMKLAEAYGIPARRLSDQNQLEEALEEFLSAPGCRLLEVAVDPEETSI